MNYQIIPGLKYREAPMLRTPELIKGAVCAYYQINESQLANRCRKESYLEPRRVAMYLMRSMTRLSLKEIGIILGGFDHTTVIHSVAVCRDLMCTDIEIKRSVEHIEKSLYD